MSAARSTSRWWRRGVPIGRVVGTPVTVTPSWFLSVAVIAVMAGPVVGGLVPTLSTVAEYAVAAVLSVLLGFSVLAHELGHCVVARRFGVGVIGVELFLLGGVSEIDRIPRTAGEEAAVAAAGPIVSAGLTVLFGTVTTATQPHTVIWLLALEIAVANGIITVFNLIPALPLDGGRLLRAAIWRQSGNRRTGTNIAVAAGYLVGAVLLGWSIYRLVGADRPTVLQALIGIAMAFYIAVGARSERAGVQPIGWPSDFDVQALARPVVGMPAETPIGLAMTAAKGREVLLLAADGVARAILDTAAGQSLANRAPLTPAGQAGQPVGPESIVLFDDEPADIAERLLSVTARYFLLIGQDGQPQGVLRREDFRGPDIDTSR